MLYGYRYFHCIHKNRWNTWQTETKFDTSNYELDRPLPKGKNKNVTGLRKDELGEKIMIKFVGLRANSYSYLMYDGSEDKKQKSQKSVS